MICLRKSISLRHLAIKRFPLVSTIRWTTSSTSHKPHFRVAIVGSGPSGCYTAKYLQQQQQEKTVKIDLIDRLPTPFGLVRSGVAPDHPDVKNVQNDFTQLFSTKTTTTTTTTTTSDHHDIDFYGNVMLGKDISLQELRELYDVVVLAYGCDSERKLGIPGEDLPGVISAREFVAWYNGHPDYNHIGELVKQALSSSSPSSDVVVIGHGNVALDCARILAKGHAGLFDTDIVAHALPVLGSGVSRISIVGRRGHIQGAFTIKEVRELVKLHDEGHEATFEVLQEELDMGMNESSAQELKDLRPKQRIDKLLRQAATTPPSSDDSKLVSLRFLLNPCRFEATDDGRLGAVVCERTQLEGTPGEQRANGTGEHITLPAQLALVSVGYKGVPIPGLTEFDEQRGTVIHNHGKVSSATDQLGGLYVSGWLKRGPSGIIGTNIADAKDTVTSIVKDMQSLSPKDKNMTSLSQLLEERNVKVVNWEHYQQIDSVETSSDRKRSASQPREKLATYEELLAAAFGN